MRRWLHLSLAALGYGLGAAALAKAQGVIGQYQQPYQGAPVVSPYMNLARPGTNPAINYFGLVRPQINTSQNLAQLQQQVQQLDNTGLGTTTMMPGGPTGSAILATGHPVAFFNYGPYFPMWGSRGRGGAGGGIGGPGGTGGGFGTPGLPIGLGIGFGNR